MRSVSPPNQALPSRGVAGDLDIDPTTLRSRITESRPPAPAPVRLAADERAEPVELRRRVRILETEREILKGAASFFARENDRTR